jgi:Fungal ATP synthase protein 8 (A6L).
MPQLVPFYYTHQIILLFIALALLILMFSKYILPNILSIYLGRYSLSDKMNT